MEDLQTALFEYIPMFHMQNICASFDIHLVMVPIVSGHVISSVK